MTPSSSSPSPSPPTDLLIIGAGVLALSTATLLQQTHPKSRITLIAAEFPIPSPISESNLNDPQATPSYASMWAGAHYRPIPFIPTTRPSFSALDPRTQTFHRQLAREHIWALQTARYMMDLARRIPEAGVEIVPGEEVLEDPPVQNLLLKSGDVYASEGDEFHVWTGREVEAANRRLTGEGHEMGRVKWGASYRTYVVNPHVYTRYLLDEFVRRGGRIVQRKLEHLSDALSCVERRDDRRVVIVNCTGTGLVSDPNTTLIRGQTVLVRKSYHKTITRQCQDGSWSFLIPRPLGGGTVVGGTKQVGDTYGKPRAGERRRLLENAAKYFPEFLGSDFGEEDVVCDNVGFRPARTGGVRVEKEEFEVEGEKVSVVHGYGAGGRGYEISWGVAQEVCGLVESCRNDQGTQFQASRL